MTLADLKLVTVVCLRLPCVRLEDRSCHSWFFIIFILTVWISCALPLYSDIIYQFLVAWICVGLSYFIVLKFEISIQQL